jgi:hypothetical protein
MKADCFLFEAGGRFLYAVYIIFSLYYYYTRWNFGSIYVEWIYVSRQMVELVISPTTIFVAETAWKSGGDNGTVK